MDVVDVGPVDAARVADPLGDSADPRRYIPREETEHALATLELFLQPRRHGDGPRVALVYGPSGLGKTLLLRVLASRAGPTRLVGYSPFLHFAPAEASAWLLEQLGALATREPDPGRRLAQMLAAPRDRPFLLLVDEAQAIPPQTAAFLGGIVRGADPSLRVVLAGVEGHALGRVVEALGVPALDVHLRAALDEAEIGDLLDAALARCNFCEPARSLLRQRDANALLIAAGGGNPQTLKSILVKMSRGLVPEPFRAGSAPPEAVREPGSAIEAGIAAAPAPGPALRATRPEPPEPSATPNTPLASESVAGAEPKPAAGAWPRLRSECERALRVCTRARDLLAEANGRLRSRLRPIGRRLSERARQIAGRSRERLPSLFARLRVHGARRLERIRSRSTRAVSSAVTVTRRSAWQAVVRARTAASRMRDGTGPRLERLGRVVRSQPRRARRLWRRLAADVRRATARSRVCARRGLGALSQLASERRAGLGALLLGGLALGASFLLGLPGDPSSPQPSTPPAPPAPVEAAPPATGAPLAVSPTPPTPPATTPPTPTGSAPLPPEAARPTADTVTIHVNARPWAHIRLDGIDLGTTPLSHEGLAPGSYRIEARFPDGRRVERTVVVSREERFFSLP